MQALAVTGMTMTRGEGGGLGAFLGREVMFTGRAGLLLRRPLHKVWPGVMRFALPQCQCDSRG